MLSNAPFWLALVAATLLNVTANVQLKLAVQTVSPRPGLGVVLQLATAPRFWIGLVAAGGLLGCYLYAVRGLPLSVAYPVVTGGAMVGLAAASVMVFNEHVRAEQALGMALVIAGITLLSRS